DGSYLKDLTVIVADLAKVVIIDNSPEVFRLQEENGIPIESWTSDPADKSLVELIPFLEAIAVADDVRPIIAQMLGRPRSIA
ncbi:Os05g0566200, partial [Oryza sativa Japonica Group]